MLQQVVLESANPMTLEIGNADPDEILILTSISGLDPADITLYTGDYAGKGGYYQGRHVGSRNPVFNFKINHDYVNDVDPSDVRDILYRQFLEPQADADGLQVRLIDDRRPDRYFIAYAEKFPSDIFTKSPSAQITTRTVEPYLKSVAETSASNAGGWLTVPITYDGSADTGIELTIKVVADTSVVTVVNNTQTMTLNGTFVADDIITINTNIGYRSIKLNGVDVMAVLSGDSTWIQLTQAANILKVYGSVVSDGMAVATQYTYRSEWWGV
jgi:hypothetical protein